MPQKLRIEIFKRSSNHGKVNKKGGLSLMKPNCFSCRHFMVTWEPASPRACRAYGFKTRELPTTVVKKSSGIECLRYEEKKKGSIR